jgi:hypothetical protein
MKKLFVILALAGMTASVSAKVFTATTKTSIVTLKDDGKKKKGKKSCSDTAKSCCKGDEKGGCCKDKKDKAPAAPKQ